ncbi:hypothetical protein ACVWZ4_001693 [Bradyrhizobium sp. USDA 4472]
MGIEGLTVTPSQSNMVFVELAPELATRLSERLRELGKMRGFLPSSVSSTTPETMWQDSKVSPSIERFSPGEASQTPAFTESPRQESCSQVL